MSSKSTVSSVARDSIVLHEAGHALVGRLVGAEIVFADMTGLTVGCPVVGLDYEPVPVPLRPQARALAALAGPIAESFANGGKHNWRQDGKVAEVAAKALVQENPEAIARKLVEWAVTTRKMLLRYERQLHAIYDYFHVEKIVRGEDVMDFLRNHDVAPLRVNAPE